MVRPRPKHFKLLLAFNVTLVVTVWLIRPEWFAWTIAVALILTILDVVVIALAQD